MRLLLPESPDSGTSESGDDVDLHQHYARGWLPNGGVRVNFISAIDGSVTVNGRSGGLQTPGDNRVFAALRDLADVVLVGAATAATEHYRPAHVSTERQQLRRSLGLKEVPAIAVVSNSLDFDLSTPLFSSSGAAPTLVLTGSAAPVSRRNDLIDLAASAGSLQLLEIRSGPDGAVDLGAAVSHLRELGYRRILCEGGPRLFSSAVLARVVDELCLTIAPMLVGPSGPRVVGGQTWPEDFLPQLRLTGLLVEDDALFCRYLVHC
jgi:riboflavin biosynthesis pyrimidine reductase